MRRRASHSVQATPETARPSSAGSRPGRAIRTAVGPPERRAAQRSGRVTLGAGACAVKKVHPAQRGAAA